MAQDKPTQAADLELKKLENQIDELIRICDGLKNENLALRSQTESLSTDRASLLEKNEQARVRVEAMINRLRSMERNT